MEKNLFGMKFKTPIGTLLALGDEKALHLVEFVDHEEFAKEIEWHKSPPLLCLEKELKLYFKGQLRHFKTPLHIVGTAFQKRAWEALAKIPYGETISYAEQANSIGQPTAYRAVAQANGSNKFTIVIPCHRVINSSGRLGGYGGGLPRKQWLLEHERT